MLILALVASLSMSSTSTLAAKIDNPWSKVKNPSTTPAESIGSPSAGCLQGAEELKQDTPGTLIMHPERHRNFAHPRLTQMLRDIGHERAGTKLSPLFIGDLSQARGGPTMSAHASHQTGLDADIGYAVIKKWNTKAPLKQRLKTPNAIMADAATTKVNKHFGPDQIELLRSIAERDAVDRILVNPAIKREICDRYSSDKSSEKWIRKLRPWYGHADHFHLRLLCAPGDKLCKQGADPLPEGNGCDATLSWWWSAEAKEETKKNAFKQQNPTMPVLPDECAAVLK
ncbi:MAG: penicillin-insensitive murein endopeptidase [Bdellovibrionales bacterium]|nr:penicillin-insensitive murein endopeptidase [Bdellovibrionales bacterium]